MHMEKILTARNIFAALVVALVVFLWGYYGSLRKPIAVDSSMDSSLMAKTALLAGGCFWSVEYDLEKVAGVIKVTTGYAGGTTENPTYGNYVKGGHREVVEVTYDPNR